MRAAARARAGTRMRFPRSAETAAASARAETCLRVPFSLPPRDDTAVNYN